MLPRFFLRARRALFLAWNVRRVAAFAGGYRALVRSVVDLWTTRGAGAVTGWATMAVSLGQHANARRYRAWLAQCPMPPRGAGTLQLITSTMGVAENDLPVFVALLFRYAPPGATMTLVTDSVGAAVLDTWRESATPSTVVRAVIVAEPSVDAMVDVARRGADGADFTALLRPGCVGGDLRPPVEPAGAELFYGDEDHVDTAGRRSRPFFKPNFSLDLLLASDYFGACLILSRMLVEALPEGSVADFHSLALRLVERAERVRRLDGFVAHRFVAPAPGTEEPPAYLPQFIRNRYGRAASVTIVDDGTPRWRCDFGNRRARVSVLVPTRDKLELLRDCVNGVFATNTGDFEVLILDNGSNEPRTLSWFEQAQADRARLRVLSAPGQFNWSRLNNQGIAHASGDVFVFLNNDTVPRSREWLARLADVAMRPDVGAVGALLLYGNGRIQHAGMVIGHGGRSEHLYREMIPGTVDHAFVSPSLPRNVVAVTGACMAVSRRAMQAVGQFDEAFAVIGNDVEWCVRAMVRGYLNVYLPDVVLLHLEMQTRGRREPASETARLKAVLARHCREDPYYNPTLPPVASGPR